jgi:tRNA threonylcarbamoyl adenosine modification protein YeaZ
MLDLTLAIESAIAGGSIALLARDDILETWSGAENVSRSEELLPRLAEMLDRRGIQSGNLSRIAVSNGPGSYTGIRIGLATTMGLARALQIPCIGVSLLNAIAHNSDNDGEKIVVVPIGRSGFCWQLFNGPADDGGAVSSGNFDELLGFLTSHADTAVLAHSIVFSNLAASEAVVNRPGPMIDIGRDLAISVGRASAMMDDGLEPFYARDVPISPSLGAPR